MIKELYKILDKVKFLNAGRKCQIYDDLLVFLCKVGYLRQLDLLQGVEYKRELKCISPTTVDQIMVYSNNDGVIYNSDLPYSRHLLPYDTVVITYYKKNDNT